MGEDFIRKMIPKGYATDDDTTTHRGALVCKVGHHSTFELQVHSGPVGARAEDGKEPGAP